MFNFNGLFYLFDKKTMLLHRERNGRMFGHLIDARY